MRATFGVNLLGATVLSLVLAGAYAPEPSVADAAMNGSVEQVRDLLARGADVNAAQGDGMTALHWAAERGDQEISTLLIGAGARAESVTRLGHYTPLHLAAMRGHVEVARQLLVAGASPAARTSTGDVTPLHFAADAGHQATVDVLLEFGAEVDARESAWGQTPLMFAAARGRTEAIRSLLRGDAEARATASVLDIRQRDAEDAEAERAREAEIMGAAVPAPGSRPAEPSIRDLDRPLSAADIVGTYGGLTALHLAVREGFSEAALALLEGGADIDQPGAGDHTSPLLMATINGHFDLALELLERGADPNLASDAGATPLYGAINAQWIPDSRHPQPSDYMQQETGYLELMEALLKAGADPNARLKYQLWFTEYSREFLGVDRAGATAFWRAAHATDVAAMKLLVAYGADPTIPTIKPAERRAQTYRPDNDLDPSGLPPVPVGGPGVSPIHAASGVGYGEGFAGNVHRHVPGGWMPTVRYLVEEHGGDVNARDFNGYTPLHNAAARGDNELILYLVAKGADPKLVARTGQTTVDMANGPVQRISPFPETILLLEGLGATNNHNCVSC